MSTYNANTAFSRIHDVYEGSSSSSPTPGPHWASDGGGGAGGRGARGRFGFCSTSACPGSPTTLPICTCWIDPRRTISACWLRSVVSALRRRRRITVLTTSATASTTSARRTMPAAAPPDTARATASPSVSLLASPSPPLGVLALGSVGEVGSFLMGRRSSVAMPRCEWYPNPPLVPYAHVTVW